MNTFQEAVFRSKVDDALRTVRTILDTTKHPARPADVPHTYADKYALAERALKAGLVATVNAAGVLGLADAALEGARAWVAANKSVSLRLDSEERCKFDKKTTREVESKTKHVTEWEDNSGGKAKRTYKSVTTIEEWHWTFTVEYKLVAFCGANPDQRAVLQGRTGSVEVITTSDKSPRPEVKVCSPIDVNATWLLQDAAAFKIDRSRQSCRTPRRNKEVSDALFAFSALHSWCGRVQSYFRSSVFPVQSLDKLDMSAINASGVFVPIVPLMLPAPGEGDGAGSLLPAADQKAFIAEQERSLDAKLGALGKAFADEKKLVTGAEANVLCAAAHMQQIGERVSHCVDYIEHMLEQQLIAAVGKELQPKDFGEYMVFHARRLFSNAFAPKPFVYAIRRPDHCPEGVLTLEADVGGGELEQPLQSIVSVVDAKKPMYFSLGAATRAAFMGTRHLHGAIQHQFSNVKDASLRLTARARQFSSFILMVGKIAAADTFEPTHAVIVQNKDDVLVPLLLETIPSAKAFRDAIESLSAEQQRFAKAFRAMQLESTLFALCVVEIKPQLERLLNLPPDGLTKEIRLTQDLMELFITYQVPADLLSYDGKKDRDLSYKLSEVKRHVKQLQDMIAESKKKELEEKKQEAKYAVADRMVGGPPAPPPPGVGFGAPPGAAYGMMMGGGGGGFGAPSGPPAAPSMAFASAMAAPPAPAPVSAPAPVPPSESAAPPEPAPPDEPKESGVGEDDGFVDDEGGVDVDYTSKPAEMDAMFDKHDKEGGVRPTKIKPATTWRKKFQKALLAQPSEKSLNKDGLRTEKNKAFDLLDALSKSGALPFGNCQLHVVILHTHCFDKSLLHTVTRDNINPIEKVERTQLLIASVVHGKEPAELVRENQLARLKEFNGDLPSIGDEEEQK